MENPPDLENFQFRGIHPLIHMGTASDRYAGWIGQVYSEDRYKGRITERSKKLKGTSFKERVLPVESVGEYFQHFSVLELDFTFYRTLLDRDMKPTPTFHVIGKYLENLGDDARLILKVPQAVFARKLWRQGKFQKNPDYLNADFFIRQFYDPAREMLGDRLYGFIFEQEYQTKKERPSSREHVGALSAFLNKLPQDNRYHMEIRTEALLTEPYFAMLEEYGVGQVLSHWTWLPSLARQLELHQGRFSSSGKQCIVRLMTPLRLRYEDAYARAFPFDRLVDGMMHPRSIQDILEVLTRGIEEGVEMNVIVNNRFGGNAPLIAKSLAKKFLIHLTRMFNK
ncbi:DUF72 domain-containing protein [Thermodesulfobacteriota bacterium]